MAAMETTIAKDCAILGYRDVLVSQDESDAFVHALVYADMLCSAFGGHLTGLMLLLPPSYPTSPPVASGNRTPSRRVPPYVSSPAPRTRGLENAGVVD